MVFLKTFGLSLVSFAVLDFLWFKFAVKDFNVKELSQIGRIKDGEFDVLLTPAVGTYILMAFAMGLIIYGIFDLTNFAILKNYPIKFMLADMAWGTFVFGLVGCLVRGLMDVRS